MPYLIGNVRFEKALCDLGANVSLMSLSVCKRLEDELKATTTSIQFAEGSSNTQ